MSTNLDFDDLPKIRRFIADRIYLSAAQQLVRREVQISNFDVRANLDHIADRLVISLTGFIHGMPKEKLSIHRQWPRTWWDALKLRWFPHWWLNRWPPNYDRVDLEQTIYLAVCPHLHDDPQHRHLEWLAAEQMKHETINRASL